MNGPYFFEEDVIGANHYLKMLKMFLVMHLKRKRKLKSAIFEEDGAPLYNVFKVREFLDANFKDRWIGHAGPISYLARSPDPSPLNFFLWGYVKDKVYKSR